MLSRTLSTVIFVAVLHWHRSLAALLHCRPGNLKLKLKVPAWPLTAVSLGIAILASSGDYSAVALGAMGVVALLYWFTLILIARSIRSVFWNSARTILQRESITLSKAKLLKQFGTEVKLPYAIFLRSSLADFVTTHGAEPQHVPHELRSKPARKELGTNKPRAALAEKLSPFPVKAIGALEVDSLATFDYGNENWRKDVLVDLLACRFIVVAPLFLSGGLAWELEQIRERSLFRKTFFFMPPELHFKNPSTAEMAWESARWSLARIGFRIARYVPQGGVLLPTGGSTYLRLCPWEQVNGPELSSIATLPLPESRMWTVCYAWMKG